MNRTIVLAVSLFAIGDSTARAVEPVEPEPIEHAPIERVVSLDFCADQFVLKLLPRENILALSPDAVRDFSYMRNEAIGVPSIRPVAEDVLTIRPEVIVRSYGGGPHAAQFFERAGVPVIQVPFSNDINDIGSAILELASEFGVPDRGREVVAEMQSRFDNLPVAPSDQSALYMTPTGVTSGAGTLIHQMLEAGGFSNFQDQPGWRSLPLERLAYEQPDVVAAAFFDADTNHPAMWSAMRHPIAKRQISDQPSVSISGSWTACGGWFLLDAIEALAARRSTGVVE